MGRICEHIKVNGKKCWTLFDSGARNTYVVPPVASHLVIFKLPKTFRSSLGGTVKKATEGAALNAQVLCGILTIGMLGLEPGRSYFRESVVHFYARHQIGEQGCPRIGRRILPKRLRWLAKPGAFRGVGW